MATYPQTIGFRDAKGQTSTVRLWIVNATPAGALTAGQNIVNAVTPLTNAAVGPAKGAYNTAPVTNAYGDDSPYPTIEDKAQLVFQTATGTPHRYLIPAPITALFEEDDETVITPDSGGTTPQQDLQTLVDAVVGDVASRDGVLISAYVGGIRVRRKMQRKFNIYTRNPQLTGPGE